MKTVFSIDVEKQRNVILVIRKQREANKRDQEKKVEH